jgi:hypothetical protein
VSAERLGTSVIAGVVVGWAAHAMFRWRLSKRRAAGPAGAVDADRLANQLGNIAEGERHFNQLQATYRGIASTWLLATFGGLGFVFSGKTAFPIDAILVGFGIALAGAAGIILLWILDLQVYHVLLEANYHTGLELERHHAELGSLRKYTNRLTRGRGVLPRVQVFYIAPVVGLFIVAAGLLAIRLYGHVAPWIVATAASIPVLAGIAACLVMWLRLRSERKRIQDLFPEARQ